MSEVLHADGRIAADRVSVLRPTDSDDPAQVGVPAGDVLVPLAVWRAQRDALAARDDVGVWLAPADAPDALVDDLPRLARIGVDFPKFTDGRGYSTASLLRRRHGWTGELRAIGDVLVDQVFYLRRCGFDVLALRSDQDASVAKRQLHVFSETYQSAADEARPAFRRRAAAEWPQPPTPPDDARSAA
ncbi:MAG: DUF934 domain-containing protein [Burkholderiales bacterium]|jgi:uncharacterized protein (DUF934 family)|nr:DUF934 domain-containing protein [Burkholderiales bacterium]